MDTPSAASERRWNVALAAVAIVWILFALRLLVADVWDETNGMVAFGDPAQSLGAKMSFAATKSLGFWRPLPTFLAVLVLHFDPQFEWAWRLLRIVNMVFLLASVGLIIAAIENWCGRSGPRRLALAVAILFSSSALITAGWYANVYDASTLLLLSYGLFLFSRGRAVAAGVVFGIAFYCKETAALILPFIFVLWVAKRITFRDALRAGIPATLLGILYFLIRGRIVPFGSATDVHQFQLEHLLPTAVGFLESFWRQTMKRSGPGIAGFVWLALSLAALKKPRVIGAVLLFLAASIIVYWGMFVTYQDGIVIHHLNFVGRLYLIPVVLMLVLLALESRPLAIAILTIPIVFGAYTMYRDHLTFQRTYARIYRTARESTIKPLTVHYPEKPLHDKVRSIEIGDIPNAAVRVEPGTGQLHF